MRKELSAAELEKRALELRRLDRLREQTAAKECEIMAEMGKILIDTREGIGRGFEKWIKANLPFSKKTAYRYIEIARSVSNLTRFFSLGRCVVYNIIELPEKTQRRLTLDTVVKLGDRRVKLRDVECCDAIEWFAALKGKRYGRPSPLARGMGHVGSLKNIREKHPEAWAELVDDVAALLSVPTPSSAVTLRANGDTRDERGRNMLAQLDAIIRIVEEVDDVGGKLSPTIKAAALPKAQQIWRAINRLPAWATPTRSPKSAVQRP